MPPLTDLDAVPSRRASPARDRVTLATGACSKPDEEIVPYVNMPERLTAGVPLYFATTLPLGGYGRGCLATSI